MWRFDLLPQSMNEKIAPILNPSKAFPKRAFDFGFNWVSLIACNPLLPLHLWITKSPWFWSWTAGALPFLQLLRRRRRRVVGVGGAVRPGGGRRPIIRLYLHVGIGVEIWSVIRHGFFLGAFLWEMEFFWSWVLCFCEENHAWTSQTRLPISWFHIFLFRVLFITVLFFF